MKPVIPPKFIPLDKPYDTRFCSWMSNHVLPIESKPINWNNPDLWYIDANGIKRLKIYYL